MNKKVLNPEVQAFIQNNLFIDTAQILFKKPIFQDISNAEIVDQILAKKKCEKKLPTWYNQANIYYPAKLSIEQTSSEITAKFKASLVIGNTIFDASGGFGVDSYYFSLVSKQVIHCEIDEKLSQIAAHNSKVLGRDNVKFKNADTITYLKSTSEKFDTIYIDPARRKENNKVFNFKDCEPNILENLPLIQSKAKRIIIKAAPMLDIKFGLSQLKNISSVYVISYKNECKEILYVSDLKKSNLETKIYCVILNDNGNHFCLNAEFSDEQGLQIDYSKIKKYIYEPDVSILKAGFFKKLTSLYPVKKLQVNTHLYTSDVLVEHFPGKTFLINSVVLFSEYERNKSKLIGNVVAKNFGIEAEKLKSKFKIKPSNDKFLIFTSNHLNQKVVIDCNRIN